MASLAAAADAAWSEIASIIELVPTAEREELIATSQRGLRGYDGEVFFTIVPQHHRCSDARSLLAESAQASGLLASLAMAAESTGQLSATESAQICRSAAQLIRKLLVRPDEGSMCGACAEGVCRRSSVVLWQFFEGSLPATLQGELDALLNVPMIALWVATLRVVSSDPSIP